MPIVLGSGCHKAATFVGAHPNAHLPPGPMPLPHGNFIVGNDFFTVKTKEELQALIDTTCQRMKQLDFQGNAGTVQAAKEVLSRAKSDSGTNVTVRWGIHQSQNRPAGFVGLCTHFTIIGDPNDWYLYVNTDGQKIAFMSNGAAPVNMVTITKF